MGFESFKKIIPNKKMLKSIKSYLFDKKIWREKILPPLIVKVIISIFSLLIIIFGIIFGINRLTPPTSSIKVETRGSDSPAQAITRNSGPVSIYNIHAEKGAIVNISPVDYQDGVIKSKARGVKEYFEEGRAYLEKGKFQEAANVFMAALDLEPDHEKRGALNIQIGNCYYELRKYLKAAEYYGAALSEARKAGDRAGEAFALTNVGITYLHRPSSDGKAIGENVRHAVENCKAALEILKKDEYPVDYAGTQNNLGTAYMDLPSSTPEERTANIRRAIDCFNEALEIRKKDEYPVQYAMTQNNLGTAYSVLPSSTPEERSGNVEKAIDCFNEALEILNKDEYPVQYAMTQNNLGNAYGDLPSSTPKERTANIRRAIDCYNAAIEICKKDKYPVEYAMARNNLGTAYGDLPSSTPEERTANIRRAIDCFNEALEIRKKDEYPADYAMTVLNLGLALLNIGEQEKGLRCVKEAYEFRQFLPDQGKSIEEFLKVDKKKQL